MDDASAVVRLSGGDTAMWCEEGAKPLGSAVVVVWVVVVWVVVVWDRSQDVSGDMPRRSQDSQRMNSSRSLTEDGVGLPDWMVWFGRGLLMCFLLFGGSLAGSTMALAAEVNDAGLVLAVCLPWVVHAVATRGFLLVGVVYFAAGTVWGWLRRRPVQLDDDARPMRPLIVVFGGITSGLVALLIGSFGQPSAVEARQVVGMFSALGISLSMGFWLHLALRDADVIERTQQSD